MSQYIALSISVLIGIGGQLALKQGALQQSTVINPFVIGGLFSYFVSSCFYIYSLRLIPLSIAFPSVSISYVAVALLAHLIWRESFGIQQILALLLIGCGIYLLYRSPIL